jgi:toxin secretion/phage lysis holin
MRTYSYSVHKYFLAIMGTDTPEGRFLVVSIASIVVVFKALFTQYVWANPSFVVGLMIVIGIDTFTGIWKARIERNFESHKLGKGTATKIITYFITLGALKQVDKFMASTWAAEISQYFTDTACALMIISEVVSVLENLAVINPNSPFAPIIKTLRRFLKSGAIEDLKPQQSTEVEPTEPVNNDPAKDNSPNNGI